MKTKSFLQFVAPSVAMMVLLLAIPMATTFYLSVRNCALEMEMVTVEESTPFGKKETVTQRARMGPDGRALQTCAFVGLDYYRKVLGLAASAGDAAPAGPPDAGGTPAPAGDAAGNEFLGALTFTMIYTFTTLPFVRVIGFLLALGVNNVTNRLKGMFITASLLPFIITPVVAALSIKWLFRDNGLVPYLLSHVGIEVFWMAQAWSARLLIIVYGIWHVVPFAFIVLYAGLQSVPQDAPLQHTRELKPSPSKSCCPSVVSSQSSSCAPSQTSMLPGKRSASPSSQSFPPQTALTWPSPSASVFASQLAHVRVSSSQPCWHGRSPATQPRSSARGEPG